MSKRIWYSYLPAFGYRSLFSRCLSSFYVCSFNWHQHAVSCNAVEAAQLQWLGRVQGSVWMQLQPGVAPPQLLKICGCRSHSVCGSARVFNDLVLFFFFLSSLLIRFFVPFSFSFSLSFLWLWQAVNVAASAYEVDFSRVSSLDHASPLRPLPAAINGSYHLRCFVLCKTCYN